MAKKQTRRTVSLNRAVYDALKAAAAERGITLAQFVETAIAKQGVAFPPHAQQTVAERDRALEHKQRAAQIRQQVIKRRAA